MSMIGGGKQMLNEDRVKADSITSGAIVHAEIVEVEEVNSGAIVIADTVIGLEDVNSGGAVITNSALSQVRTGSGGSIHSSIESYIGELHTEIGNLDPESAFYEDRKEELNETIEMLENLEMKW